MAASGSIQIIHDYRSGSVKHADVLAILHAVKVSGGILVRYHDKDDALDLVKLFEKYGEHPDVFLDFAEECAPVFAEKFSGGIHELLKVVASGRRWVLECSDYVLRDRVIEELASIPVDICGDWRPSTLYVSYGVEPRWAVVEGGIREVCLSNCTVSLFGYGSLVERAATYDSFARLPVIADLVGICSRYLGHVRVLVSWG